MELSWWGLEFSRFTKSQLFSLYEGAKAAFISNLHCTSSFHYGKSISYSPNNLGNNNKKASRAANNAPGDHPFVKNNQSSHSHGPNYDNEDVLSFISSNATTRIYWK